MATWRELGEVPDSDDDGDFDNYGQAHDSTLTCSFNLDQHNGAAPSTSQAVPTHGLLSQAKNTSQSMCDIPASSPIGDAPMVAPLPERPSTPQPRVHMAMPPASSPLSSAPDDDELADMFSEGPYRAAASAISKPSRVVVSARGDSPDPLGFETDDVSAGLVELTEPLPEFLFDRDHATPVLPPVSTQHLRRQHSAPPSPETASAIAAAVTAAQRYERSLRPRKPIQEHPYMIESAQYNKALKARGIKPVRMLEEAHARGRNKTPEEDSQEQEFQEESQNTVSEHQERLCEESQSLLHESLDYSAPLPTFPSPSTAKTSSQPPRNTSSSPRSVSRETNVTSPFIDCEHHESDQESDELPSLKQLLTAQTPSFPVKRHPSSLLTSSRKSTKKSASHISLEPTSTNLHSVHAPHIKFRQPRPLPPAALKAKNVPKHSRGSRSRPPGVDTSEQITPSRPRPISPEQHPLERPLESPSVNLSAASHADDASDSEVSEESNSTPKHGKELVAFGRRARGVLPASHFRLDRPRQQPKPHRAAHARAMPPDPTQRRGIAMPRTKTTSNQSPSTPIFPFDLFDDDESEAESLQTPKPRTEKRYSQQILHIVDDDDDDDDMSVVEDNEIDHMVQRPKRQLTQSISGASSAKRRKLDQSGARQRQQPTITSHFGSGNGTSAKRQKPPRRSQNKDKSSRRASKKKSQRTYNPPRLGILDVIEPEAPRFLRLAARTVKSKAQRGRSSPSRKTICLGTREDQLDAGRVLQDWIGGEIHPRHSVTSPSTAIQGSDRQPLAHISHNGAALGSSESHDTPTDSSSRIIQPKRNATAKNPSRMLPRSRAASVRPAQFEADVMNEAGTVNFQTKKRVLDAIYRRGARPRSVSQSTISLMTRDNDGPLVIEETESAVRKDASLNVAKSSRRRLKKTEKPTRVDTRAPQYRHAHDPLPSGPRTDGHISAADLGVDQLLGLAPFGAHYSEHFEIFPLQRGVFFHEETLLGSGCFQASLAPGLLEKIKQPRPRIHFNLSGQPLKWGLWDEQVSSELGILIDAICNHLTETGSDVDSGFDTKDAARFMRTYVQDSLSVTDDTKLGMFLSRLLLVFEGFFSRFKVQAIFLDQRKTTKTLEVLSEFLIIVLCSHSICRDRASMIPQIMGLENILREVVAASVACLLHIGTASLVTAYGSLQQLTNRERGIRADNIVAQTWVMLMRALGQLRIPRMSFWDVTFSVLIKGEDKTSLDVQRFEQLWETMFTLLPLCEFDSSGILVSESRHSVAMDGWALPQLALKRVFQLYKANNRQPPGFNDYCRTIVRRCIYLVEHWGWYKCGGVIGTVFDFFGSQNLSNLRNEEVFQSPAFLERLHVETALRVEPEDRCFHIFLKLVALTIQRLVQTGSDREIRNLVARTLPNHDRQYLKEQNVHQHDLAALRNHHDLLCTLFWATPAELRPSTLLALLEKLVVPSSSHKEACLINLKAWAQLARFVVHKESVAAFRPFHLWQGSAFQQLLDQYDSTASDIQQQLSSMSKDGSHGIDQNFINGIIASNKSATMEVIRYSVTISLDVAKYARSLELSIFAGNIVQLRHVFRQFSKSPAEYPLSLLKDAVATVDVFLVHVERALGRAQTENNAAGLEDGIMKIDNDLTADFYAMARGMLQTSSTGDHSPQTISKTEEAREQVVTVAGRLAAILIRCGTIRLSRCFKTNQRSKAGKHELFEGLPSQLGPLQSRYLPLFLANLHKELDLTDVGVSVLQLWLLSLTKPRDDMLFEHQFALSLKKLKYPFLPAESDMLRHANYDMNCDMLRKTLMWMRTSLRISSTPSQKKSNTSDYSAALKAVMQRIQNDLHEISVTNDAQHTRYVQFVRRVVSLVKSHTTEIFQIPPFFYQVSKEYSPPVQDPHLQVDSIKSYGLRLNEGDSPAMPQLFYYMYNNFKQALLHGRLGHETRILAKGMKDDAILGFILGKMLPVVLSASVMKPEAFVLFDTYCEAIRLRLDAVAARQMDQSRAQLPTLFRAMMRWIRGVRCLNDGILCVEHLHLFRKMVVLLAMLQPTLTAASYDTSAPAAAWSAMQQALSCWSEATKNAESRLASSLADPYEDDVSAGLFQDVIMEDGFVGEDETLVASLARGTITDFERNWLVTAELIVAQAPARATQAGQGLARPHWDMKELGQSLLRELQRWNAWWARCRAHMQDELVSEAEEMMLL